MVACYQNCLCLPRFCIVTCGPLYEPCCIRCSVRWTTSLPVIHTARIYNSFLAPAVAAEGRILLAQLSVKRASTGRQNRIQSVASLLGLMTCTVLQRFWGDSWHIRTNLWYRLWKHCQFVCVCGHKGSLLYEGHSFKLMDTGDSRGIMPFMNQTGQSSCVKVGVRQKLHSVF